MLAPGIVAFLIAVAFWPGVPNAAVAPRWTIAWTGCALLLWGVRQRPTAGHALGAALLLYAAASLCWGAVFVESLDGFCKLAIVTTAFLLGAGLRSLEGVYAGFALGVGVSGVLALFQVHGIGQVPQLVVPGGLFANKNFMGEAAALAIIPALLQRRLWPCVPALAAALYLSGSRASWLALAIAGVLWLWRRHRLAAGAAALGLALVMLRAAHHDPDLTMRVAIWGDTIRGFSWLGQGIGSYWSTAPKFVAYLDIATRADHAHNDLMELAFELGLPGVALAVGVLVHAYRHGDESERLVLAAWAVIGVFGFPLHIATTAVLAALVAGRAAARGPLLRGALARCGMALRQRLERSRHGALRAQARRRDLSA